MNWILNNDLAAISIVSILIVASFLSSYYTGFQNGLRKGFTGGLRQGRKEVMQEMYHAATGTNTTIPPYDASGSIPPMFKEGTYHDETSSRP